jgi:AcrR family transcriptional regulator
MPPTPPAPRSTRAPYRRADAVKADILTATVALLSERPVHDIGVRDIAERAGVQHSLVTRHFGSKEALIALAVDSAARDYAGAVEGGGDDAAGFVDAMRHLRERPFTAFVLAVPASERVGETAEERFPGFAAHLRRLDADGAPLDLRTKVAAGMAFGMAMAWNLFEEVLLDGADVDPADAPRAREVAEELLADFVRSSRRG